MKVNLNSLRDFSIFCVIMPRKSLSESGMCDLKFLFGLSERGKLDVIQFYREKGIISSKYECPDCGPILDGTWLFLDERFYRPARPVPRVHYFFIVFFAV